MPEIYIEYICPLSIILRPFVNSKLILDGASLLPFLLINIKYVT